MLRVIIADDHEIVREGLKAILSQENTYRIVGEAGSLEDLRRLLSDVPCDVLLLDLAFQDGSALEQIKVLKKNYPGMKVIILSAYPENEYAIKAKQAGAEAYLSKECLRTKLLEVIRGVAAGATFFKDEPLPESRPRDSDFELVNSLLSSREYEVFIMIAKGVATKNIARDLELNSKTVSTYQRRILQKLNLNSKGQLIRFAVERGFLNRPALATP